MKRVRILKNIMKRTNVDKILLAYVIVLFAAALIIMLREPGITNFSDSLWYCYTMAVTIGFGDIVVTTLLGKFISVVLSLYSLLLIGLIPGIVVNYYMAIVKVKEETVMENFLDKLENLEELSHDELADLSSKVRARTKKA
ncbi:MAG: potassium channel family protein [Eubacteriaceae bacterium]|nr:potassium channel family protein [Eubacteriaceae bacterium]